MSTLSNNRVRKSLADQIDRLNAVIDGFADNLDQVVATAVKEGVTEAVRVVLHEILTHPELSKRLRPSAEANFTPRRVSVWARDVLGRATAAVRSAVHTARTAISSTAKAMARHARQVPIVGLVWGVGAAVAVCLAVTRCGLVHSMTPRWCLLA